MLFLANIRRAYKIATYRPTKAISYAIDYLHHRPYSSKSTNNSKFCRGKKSGKKGKRPSDRWKRGSKKKLSRKSSTISPVALIADKNGGPSVALIPINLFEEGLGEENGFRDALSILTLLRENRHEVESFMESSSNLRRKFESDGPSITEITEGDIEQLDREILGTRAEKQPLVESKYFDVGRKGFLQNERVERHLLPKDMLRELKNVSISGMQLNFEMNMTNIRDAILNPDSLKEVKDKSILNEGDSRMALTTNIQVYPQKGKTVPLQLNALIHGTVSIDPEKFSKEKLNQLQVAQFNEYVTAVAANLCSKALKKGFPMRVSRNLYTSEALNDSERKGSSFEANKELKGVEMESEKNATQSRSRNVRTLNNGAERAMEVRSVDYTNPKHADLNALLSRNTTAAEGMIRDEYAQTESRDSVNIDESVVHTERIDKGTEENAKSADRREEKGRNSIETDRNKGESEIRERAKERNEESVTASARFAEVYEMEKGSVEEDAEITMKSTVRPGLNRVELRKDVRQRMETEQEEPRVESTDGRSGAEDVQWEPFQEEKKERMEFNEGIVELAPEYGEAGEKNIGAVKDYMEVQQEHNDAAAEYLRNVTEARTEDKMQEAQVDAIEDWNVHRRWKDSVDSEGMKEVLGEKTRPLETNAFEEERDVSETEVAPSESPARIEIENIADKAEERPSEENILENKIEDELPVHDKSINHNLDDLDRRIQRFLQSRKTSASQPKSLREAERVFQRNAVALEKNAHALEKNADVLGKLVDALELPDSRLQFSAPNNPATSSVQSEMDKTEIARQIEMAKGFHEDLEFSKYANARLEFSKRDDGYEAYQRDDEDLATTYYGKIGLEDSYANQAAEPTNETAELTNQIKDLHTQFNDKLDTFKGLPSSYAIGLNTATAIPGKGDDKKPKKNPHIVCVRKGAKGCKSPGLAGNAPYVAKKTSAKDTGSMRSGVSLHLLECGLYQKALEEAASRRRTDKCGKRSSSSTSKSGSDKKKGSSCGSTSKSGSGERKGSGCGSTPPCQNKDKKQQLPPASQKSSKSNDPCKRSPSKSGTGSSKRSSSCSLKSENEKKKGSGCGSTPPCQNKSKNQKLSPISSKNQSKCEGSLKSNDLCKRSASMGRSGSEPCKKSATKRSKSSDSCQRSSCSSKKTRSASSSSKKPDSCKRSASKSKDPCKRSSSKSSFKSNNPCKRSSSKSKDPCKRSSSSSSSKSDPCKRSSLKSKDPCKRSSTKSKDPCKRSSSKSKDPCKRSSSSSFSKSDPCKRSSSKSKDPCKGSSSKSKDPCKRSSSKSKDPCKRSSSKSKDPCKRSSSKPKDPCKRLSSKSKDPCKQSSSCSSSKSDPCKRSSSKSKDPCKRSSSKSKDPCKRSSSKSKDPCKRSPSKSKDPCKRSSRSKHPCKTSSSKSKDPCKRSSSKSKDPCKRSSSKYKDPCKRSSSKNKNPCKSSSSKSKDPCKRSSSTSSKQSSQSCSSKTDKCPPCTPKRKFHSLCNVSTPLPKPLDDQVFEIVRCFSDNCPPKEGKTNYLPRNAHTNDIRRATCQKFSWRDDRKRRKLKEKKKNCYPDETIGMCPDTDCYRIFLKYEEYKRDQRKKRCARRMAADKRKKGMRENKVGSKRNPFLLPINCVTQQIRCCSSEDIQNEKAVILSPHKVCKKKTPLKPVKENDVRVWIDCIALSESDIHMFETGAKKYPQITLGNEASGVVQEVGKNVKHLKPGDHVALECGVPCARCQLCLSGRYNLCQQLTFKGCLKKYCTHPALFCHKIIKRVPLSYASMAYQLSLGCNACKQAAIKPNSNVAIIGSCAMTLCTAMCAQAMGCSNICVICTTDIAQDIVAENITEKVECIDSQTSVKAIYRMICDSLCTNPDTVINCLCSTKTMNASIMALKPAGICVVSAFLSECVSHNVMDALMKEIQIVPSFRSRNMFPFAIHLLERKQVPIACLIADCLEWKNLEAGFEKALTESNCGPRKVVVQCREDNEEDGNAGVKKNKLFTVF